MGSKIMCTNSKFTPPPNSLNKVKKTVTIPLMASVLTPQSAL